MNQKNEPLLDDIREAASIVSAVLLELKALTAPGVSLEMLDEVAERMILERGGTPYNKGYQPEWATVPYPATICACVNEEVCHATPAGKTLKEGDIVTYDLGVKFKSGCGDAALTVAVGEISNRKERTMRYCLRALEDAIKEVKAGVKINRIGDVIQSMAIKHGYNIIKEYGGHHIGAEMHENPLVLNHYVPDNEEVLVAGKVICIEPMFTPGNARLGVMGHDKWTVFCLDDQPCAMFEHMILVKEDGYEVLTTHI